MRKFVIVSLAALTLLAASFPASAATRLRAYRGQTSAGTSIAFLVRVADDGRMSLKEMRMRVQMVCDDASTIDYRSWWGFGGVGVRFEGRNVTLDITFHSEAMHITGVFRPHTADGTFKNTMATLTDNEQAQLCTTGDLTWTADRVDRHRGTQLGSPRGADVVHRVGDEAVRRSSRIG